MIHLSAKRFIEKKKSTVKKVVFVGVISIAASSIQYRVLNPYTYDPVHRSVEDVSENPRFPQKDLIPDWEK